MFEPITRAALGTLMASLRSQGGEAVKQNHAPFAHDLQQLLAVPPSDVPDVRAYHEAVVHGFSYYNWSWDPRALEHYDALCGAVERWGAEPAADLDLLCDLVDFLFFICWCFPDSSTAQCRLAVPAMRPAAAAFARTRPQAPAMPQRPDAGRPMGVVWLAMYADGSSAMMPALRHTARALLRPGSGFTLTLYAWRFADPATLDWLQGLGAKCHVMTEGSATERILAIEAQILRDRADIVISDMNNAIPTALFARQIAPVQILMQSGMPAWPVRPLHAVFNSFGFDPEVACWGNARLLPFNPPWDLALLAPPEDSAETARERTAVAPCGRRLIGCYGRLVKVTAPYLQAVEQILQHCPDVVFLAGGTGDDAHIRAFAANSPVGERIRVEKRFVSGHVWGRMLDLFLDTWPVTGGESCREVIAKNRPVVTMQSAEMPAIHAQRDGALVTPDWDGFVAASVRLLTDPAAYAAACLRAAALTQRMTDTGAFARQIAADLMSLRPSDEKTAVREMSSPLSLRPRPSV